MTGRVFYLDKAGPWRILRFWHLIIQEWLNNPGKLSNNPEELSNHFKEWLNTPKEWLNNRKKWSNRNVPT